jgi:hypothetical protein
MHKMDNLVLKYALHQFGLLKNRDLVFISFVNQQ